MFDSLEIRFIFFHRGIIQLNTMNRGSISQTLKYYGSVWFWQLGSQVSQAPVNQVPCIQGLIWLVIYKSNYARQQYPVLDQWTFEIVARSRQLFCIEKPITASTIFVKKNTTIKRLPITKFTVIILTFIHRLLYIYSITNLIIFNYYYKCYYF